LALDLVGSFFVSSGWLVVLQQEKVKATQKTAKIIRINVFIFFILIPFNF
jgi:hypothetical protein